MIPITLEFVAFGPFLKKQTIDFKKFENDKIFLISGQTGSGKTTIFDAITFSLFGEASGCVRQTDSFKSQFADAKDLCYVEFEFCIHNKIYKVYREPIQFKLKRTGNLVRTNSTAILTLDDGQIISGKEPVDKYIEQLLGINSEQFKKIVMLPQGEFKKFLLDDNVEKQKILRTIFNTKILNDFTEKLRENMNIYKIQHDEILTEQSAYMKSIKCEEGDELFLELDSSQKDVSHIQKLLHENIKNSQEKLNIQKEKINQLTQEIKEINLPLYTQINQKFLQLEQTKKELNELKNKKTTIDVYQEKLDFLKKIRDILPIFNLKNVTSTQLDEQNENLLEYKKSLENAKINLDNEKKFNQECKNQQKFEPEIILKIENISVQHKILDDIESNKFALKTTILDTEKMKNNQNSYNVYIDYLKICEGIIALENEICLANEAIKNDDLYEKLVVEFLEKQKNYEKVFHDFLNCQSANLAQKLKTDEPCPVCGSTFHPKLAIFSSEAVTQNQVEKEKNIYEKITKEVEKIKTICEQQ
ncbi:MAG: AAA family ATPase, partial [Oscillospiraceae bacterium]